MSLQTITRVLSLIKLYYKQKKKNNEGSSSYQHTHQPWIISFKPAGSHNRRFHVLYKTGELYLYTIVDQNSEVIYYLTVKF